MLPSGPKTDKTTVIGLHLIVRIVNESNQEMVCFKLINWTTLIKETDWAPIELELKDEKHRTRSVFVPTAIGALQGTTRMRVAYTRIGDRTALIYPIMIAINKVAVLHRSLHAID